LAPALQKKIKPDGGVASTTEDRERRETQVRNEGKAPTSFRGQAEENYGGKHSRPENKRLGTANEPSLLSTSFMKFRGPQALKDRVENHCAGAWLG
jgi:hypothetical protein